MVISSSELRNEKREKKKRSVPLLRVSLTRRRSLLVSSLLIILGRALRRVTGIICQTSKFFRNRLKSHNSPSLRRIATLALRRVSLLAR